MGHRGRGGEKGSQSPGRSVSTTVKKPCGTSDVSPRMKNSWEDGGWRRDRESGQWGWKEDKMNGLALDIQGAYETTLLRNEGSQEIATIILGKLQVPG